MNRALQISSGIFVVGIILFIASNCYLSAYNVYRESVPRAAYFPPIASAEFVPWISFAMGYFAALRIAKEKKLGLTKRDLYLKFLVFSAVLTFYIAVTLAPVHIYAHYFNPFM